MKKDVNKKFHNLVAVIKEIIKGFKEANAKYKKKNERDKEESESESNDSDVDTSGPTQNSA